MNIHGKRIKDKPNCIPVGMMRTLFEQSMLGTKLMGPEDLGTMEINGNFSHYFKPDVDLVWLGFALGMRCSERMEEAVRKIDPPPGTALVTEGRVKKGDWFFVEALQGWSQCPPSAYGEEIAGATSYGTFAPGIAVNGAERRTINRTRSPARTSF